MFIIDDGPGRGGGGMRAYGIAMGGKVEPPKTNSNRNTNTMYHMHTLGASKCMHVIHSVGFAIVVVLGWFYLIWVVCHFLRIFSVGLFTCWGDVMWYVVQDGRSVVGNFIGFVFVVDY